MGKQYITTATASLAHELDISGVTITNKYTVTVSSDGYACFWDNKQEEGHEPNEHVIKHMIHEIGLHHVAVYENTPPNSTTKVILLAFAAFDGSIIFYYFVNDDVATLTKLDTGKKFVNDFWCPNFFKDPRSQRDLFVVTRANGATDVFNLTVTGTGAENDVTVNVGDLVGSLHASSSTSFPNSLGISPTSTLCAVGYTSGDVVIFSLDSLKPTFTFHTTDVRTVNGPTSSSVPRAIAFSPGGTLLAVARDNQSAGSIALYDVEFGENVGSLTALTHSAKTTIGGFAHEGWVMALNFNEDGSLLASAGFDKCIRVWNIELREREATIQISATDLDTPAVEDNVDLSICSGVAFIKRGVRGGAGGDTNEGLCVVSFDRGVRWYREAGGI